VTRIVLDPDEVNQDAVVTLTDGTTELIATLDRATIGRVSRQLARYASVYADAYDPADAASAARFGAGDLALGEVAPLHRAIARRHAELRDEPGRGATDVDATALLETRRWTTGGGVARRLEDLTPSHRANLLGWLERHSDALRDAFEAATTSPRDRAQVLTAEPWVAGTPIHRTLTALQEHVTGKELAMDEARQVARRIAYETTGRWPTD
jgi:hypothetical protein